jgi:HAE1 family hydrophobic/amphiphilic exporter-1
VAIGSGEGADFRAPLGRAVIGGVVTSTILTLLVIPTVYDILSGWRDRAMGLLKRPAAEAKTARRKEPMPEAEPGMARAMAGPEA